MKKILFMLGGLVCVLLCSLSVKADVIWEPEDSFYQKHASECTHVNRRFIADGPDGKVILYRSPEVADVTGTWENGFKVWISFTYEDKDGIVWGVYEDRNGAGGWMPMEYMKLIYDGISFQEEYGDEITGESGTLEGRSSGESINFWRYPGDKGYDTSMEILDYPPEYSGVYVDEKGHKWGHVGYYFGLKSYWICIDQPSADYEELYPDGGPAIGSAADTAEDEERYEDKKYGTVAESSPDRQEEKTDRIAPRGADRAMVTAAVMVVLVAAVSAVLLIILKKGKKK